MSSEKHKQNIDEKMKATGHRSPYDDKDFSDALDQGVMHDKLNLKFITFWSIAGIISVIVLIVIAAELFSYYYFQRSYNVSIASEHFRITRLTEESRQRLGSTGVIDEESGRYHIPVDSAYTLILEEYNN
jgi:hypothetical protein